MTISFESHVRTVAKDEIIFKEGDEASQFFIVKSGSIRRLKRSGERLVAIGVAGEKEIVGEEGVLLGHVHGYSAIAAEESDIVAVDAGPVGNVLEAAPAWISDLFKTLAERYSGTSDAIAEHRISDVELGGGDALPPKEENRLKKILTEQSPQ